MNYLKRCQNAFFRIASFALINSLIACSDWSNLYLCTNITEVGNIFYTVLNAFPRIILKFQSNLNKQLARLKNVKSRLYKEFPVPVHKPPFPDT